MVAKVPVPEQQLKWRRAREGFPKDILEEELRKIGVSVRKLDDHLAESEWLVGESYSLADICNFAIANGMEMGFPEMVNESDTPHLLRWIRRINERPAAKAMFARVPRERFEPARVD
jgi:glutathione S-transferase